MNQKSDGMLNVRGVTALKIARNQVSKVDGGGTDADQDFSGLRRGLRHLGEMQHIGRSVFSVDNGFHEHL